MNLILKNPREKYATQVVQTWPLAAMTALTALLAASVATPLRASDECGTGTAVTCSDPDYSSGITYSDVGDFTLDYNAAGGSVDNGIQIEGANASSGQITVNMDAAGSDVYSTGSPPTTILGSGALTVATQGASSGKIEINIADGNLAPIGYQSRAIGVSVADAAATTGVQFIMSGGNVSESNNTHSLVEINNYGTGDTAVGISGGSMTITGNNNGAYAISAFSGSSALATVTASMSGGTISVETGLGGALRASSHDAANAIAEMSGGMITSTVQLGNEEAGLGTAVVAKATGSGAASTSMSGGTITVQGPGGSGLGAVVNPSDPTTTTNAYVEMSGGTISTNGDEAWGVNAVNYGSGQASVNVVQQSPKTVSITTDGLGSAAVRAVNHGLGDASMTLSDGTFTTLGASSAAALAKIDNSASAADANITVNRGSFSTNGLGSNAIHVANNGAGSAEAFVNQSSPILLSIQTQGDDASGILARNTGTGSADATFQKGTVTTTGSGAHGVASIADNNANAGLIEANYYAGTIETSGASAYGVYAASNGTGAVQVVAQNDWENGEHLSTSGAGSHGAYGYQSGAGTLFVGSTGSAISTNGNDASGLYALIDNTGNSSELSGSIAAGTISTIGKSAHGAAFQSLGSGAVDVSLAYSTSTGGIVMSTAGDSSHGVYVQSAQSGDASVSGGFGSITTAGAGSHAVYVANSDTAGSGNASATLTAGTINVSGAGSHGLNVETMGSGKASISLSDAQGGPAITASGADAFGVTAYSAGGQTEIALGSGKVTATGSAQAAVGFTDMSSVGNATKASVTIGSSMMIDASQSSNGYSIWNGDDRADTSLQVKTLGTVTGDAMLGGGDSTFVLTGGSFTGNIYGDYDEIKGAPSDTVNQGADNFIWEKYIVDGVAKTNGGSLNSGFYGQGGDDTATVSVGTDGTNLANAVFDGGIGKDDFTFSNALPGSGRLVSKGLSGEKFTNWETFTVGNAVDVTFVDDGLSLSGYGGGNANGLGDFRIDRGASVTAGAAMGSSFALNGNVSNDGMLSMQDGAYGGNIFIGGDYTSDKGILAIDVDFGALVADTLTFGGSVGGFTDIKIADVGTTGVPGAILLADMSDGSDIDTSEFGVLGDNGTVVSGVYAYELEYDLEGAPDAGLKPGLYLSATGSPSNPVGPKLQPFVPLYEGYQAVLLDMNRLPTMRQRVGKRAWMGADRFGMTGDVVPGSTEGSVEMRSDQDYTMVVIPEKMDVPAIENVWGRIDGNFSHNDPASASTGYKYDLSSFEMQTGIDGLFYDEGPGALVGGITAHYRTGEAKFKSGHGDGKIHPEGWGFGGTLTWYGDNGFYTDGQAQMTWYSSELKTEDLAKGIDNSDAFGYALSIEAGQQILMGSNDIILTPQAQMSWSSVNISNFTGAYNDDVNFGDGNSLLARLGLAVEKEMFSQDESGLGRNGNIYGIANIYSELAGENTATIEAYQASSSSDAWTGEIGFGGTYDWEASNKVVYGIYGEVTASTGLDTGSFGYGGNVGFRVRW